MAPRCSPPPITYGPTRSQGATSRSWMGDYRRPRIGHARGRGCGAAHGARVTSRSICGVQEYLWRLKRRTKEKRAVISTPRAVTPHPWETPIQFLAAPPHARSARRWWPPRARPSRRIRGAPGLTGGASSPTVPTRRAAAVRAGRKSQVGGGVARGVGTCAQNWCVFPGGLPCSS